MLKKRLKKLETHAASMVGQHLSEQEIDERIKCFLDRMTDAEIAEFEKEHGFPEGHIENLIA